MSPLTRYFLALFVHGSLGLTLVLALALLPDNRNHQPTHTGDTP